MGAGIPSRRGREARNQSKADVDLPLVDTSLIADSTWYAAGRAFGDRVLSRLCCLSTHPGSCVTSAQGHFARWGGAWTLVVAKFVPGLSLVGPPIAGAPGRAAVSRPG
jgi:membrane protein DedA with SNARE-associated domain